MGSANVGNAGAADWSSHPSQLACVNHLEPARLDRAAAAQVLGTLALNRVPVHLDDGFVEYEWIGRDSYLGEDGPRTRGANITSIDALMVGGRDGERILVVIEWKYLGGVRSPVRRDL